MIKRIFFIFSIFWIVCSLPIQVQAFSKVEYSENHESRKLICELLQAMRLRLVMMHEVAKYKWNEKAPIEDLEREKVLLSKFGEEAKIFGIDPHFAKIFLQAQMDAAKILQKRDFLSWQEENHPNFEEVLDLKNEIRPILDDLTKKILNLLAKIPPAAFLNERLWMCTSEEILIGEGIDTVVREAALKPFVRILSILERPFFVQAGPGSFNYQALQHIFVEDILKKESIHFCGNVHTSLDCAAVSSSGLAFLAIRNSLIEGGWVPQNFEALKGYQIVKVSEAVRMKIEMSLLRHMEAIEEEIPLTKIAAHPAAFLQIEKWKEGRHLQEISIDQGSSEAARKLTSGELSLDTGIIGPKALEMIYPNLVAVEKGIQDAKDNETLFALIEVRLLEKPLSEDVLKKHLAALFSKYSQNDQPTEYYKIY